MQGTVRVALIGHGFMGAAHSVGWRQAPRVFDLAHRPEMSVLVGRSSDAAAQAAAKWGWADSATDWREVIGRDEVGLVDIVTPGDSHCDIAVAALEAGKHVLCEKPLAKDLAEAELMAAAAERAAERGIRAMVGFTYRRVPAVTLMRDLVSRGEIGEIQRVRASYEQDWLVDPWVPLTWRLQREQAGSGALGDIGAHIIDMARFVTGEEVLAVSGVLDTVIPHRPRLDASSASADLGRVTVDDTAVFAGRLSGGALASFEATRMASGRKNALRFEVSGTRGALSFDLEDLNHLQFHDRTAPLERQGFTSIPVTEGVHPYVAAWWPPGHMLGYEHAFTHQVADLLAALDGPASPTPSFADGLAVQRVIDAVERSNRESSVWTDVLTEAKSFEEDR